MLIMKLNKLFHWLYFCVMALPLVVAPIFAIYSHRHTLTEQTTVDIQYKYQSNEVNSNNDLIVGNYYYLEYVYFNDSLLSVDSSTFNFYVNDIHYFGLQFENFNTFRVPLIRCDTFIYNLNGTNTNIIANTNIASFGLITPDDASISSNYLAFSFSPYYSISNGHINIGENYLTQTTPLSFIVVRGVIEWRSDIVINYDDYYKFFSVLDVENNPIVSADLDTSSSDIMSVFVNNYAEAISKYFNYDNAFNFGGLYNWLNTNFFSGNAPLGFFIFWHLLIYWLLTSLLWLIFDVLMYVPMLVHRWLDKASLS